MFPFGPVDEEFVVQDYILPATEISVSYNGSDVTEYLLSYQISGSRGGGISGSIVLKDRDGYIAALLSQYNQSNSSIRAHNMTATRTLVITASQGTTTTAYPVLIPGDPSWDNDATLTFNFTDKTPIIDLDNQNIGDYVFFEGDDVTSHDVIDDVEAAVGQTITPGFSAFDIGTFRANEANVLSILDEISTIRQAYRKWISGNLTLEVLAEAAPTTHIIERLHIPDGGMTASKDTSNLRTYFKFFRDKPLASTLGEAACTGKLGEESQCVGRVVEIAFNRPTKHAIIYHTENKGTIEDGVFYDEDDNPLPNVGGWFNFYGSPGNEAVRWIGTYVPEFDLGTDMFVPSWSVIAVGGPLVAEESGDFEAEKTLSEIEALYGHRPEYKNLETQILRSITEAQAMLDAIALEVTWSIRKFALNTPFLLSEREGDFIEVTHAKHSLDEELCLIDSWSHSFSFADGWDNSYNLLASI